EAYYFVPVQLALGLQQSGDYVAALDWFRTVYDYVAPIPQRKIYYGLVLEESFPQLVYVPETWLADDLNPHVIAATRRNAYTRYTVIALVRCLLDYADTEFSRDSADSVPHARVLYEEAQALLDVPELSAGDGCRAAMLKLDVSSAAALWRPRLRMLQQEI